MTHQCQQGKLPLLVGQAAGALVRTQHGTKPKAGERARSRIAEEEQGLRKGAQGIPLVVIFL